MIDVLFDEMSRWLVSNGLRGVDGNDRAVEVAVTAGVGVWRIRLVDVRAG